MLLHTIVLYSYQNMERKGLEITHDSVLFFKFIRDEIFPGGELEDPDKIENHARAAGFEVLRRHCLGSHYARTLDEWATRLIANRDQAIARRSVEVYDRYMKYLNGCAKYFRSGHLDLCQFTLAK